MHLDIWALHLDSTSPELEYEEERNPSWISYMGWVSELQVRRAYTGLEPWVGSLQKARGQ